MDLVDLHHERCHLHHGTDCRCCVDWRLAEQQEGSHDGKQHLAHRFGGAGARVLRLHPVAVNLLVQGAENHPRGWRSHEGFLAGIHRVYDLGILENVLPVE